MLGINEQVEIIITRMRGFALDNHISIFHYIYISLLLLYDWFIPANISFQSQSFTIYRLKIGKGIRFSLLVVYL